VPDETSEYQSFLLITGKTEAAGSHFMYNAPKDEHQEFTRRIIRRIWAFRALRKMRGVVDEIEQEEATDKKLLRVLWIVLALILALAAILVYLHK
jgi:hypothetical protein